MGFWSLKFVALVVVSLLFYHLSPTARRRRLVLALGSLVFVASYAFQPGDRETIGGGAASLLGLFAFAVLAHLFQKYAPRVAGGVYAAMICVLLLCYIVLKHIIPSFPAFTGLRGLLVIGLSYIMFRALHLIMDSRSGALERPVGIGSFFNYLFFWPTFLSGPIWRYQNYALQMEDAGQPLSRQDTFSGLSRISMGCVKILALAETALFFHGKFASALLVENPGEDFSVRGGEYAVAALLFLLYTYFDFSGYTDMVIGLGTLFGLSLPENFNRPFACRDVLDFWNRWHITLSQWMLQYFFTPLMIALTRRFGGKNRIPYLGVCGYSATFFIIGLWHGVGARYALFGAALAIVASGNKLWDAWLPLMLGKKKASEVKAGRFYKATLGGGSVFLLAASLSTIWVDPSLTSKIDASFLIMAFLTGLVWSMGVSAVEWLIVALTAPLRLSGAEKGTKGLLKITVNQTWLAVKCLIAIGALFMQGEQMPVFIYEGF